MSRIPSLLFSTRSANPVGGVDFNREIVAESPNVPREARELFGRSADITLTARSPKEKVEVFLFRPFRPGGWIFCRAVSLGLYRKTSHHLLIHGLVLHRGDLDALDGNPFLLATGEAACFQSTHPGGRKELMEIEFPRGIQGHARAMNQQRFLKLGSHLGGEEDAFLRLFDQTRQGEAARHELQDPGADWAEWMLLHFHPDDRAEVSFHTWAIDGVDKDYDLSFLPMAPGKSSRQRKVEAPSQVAQKTLELRRLIGGDKYGDILRRYLLTYRSEREAKPLTDDRALLALRFELGEALDEGEEEIVRRVRLRGLRKLPEVVAYLSSVWQEKGFQGFWNVLTELVEVYPTVHLGKLSELKSLNRDDPREIWSALELVRRKRAEDVEVRRLEGLFRALVNPAKLRRLLKLFEDPRVATQVRDHLSGYIMSAIQRDLSGTEGDALSLADLAYWTDWEDWCARQASGASHLLPLESLVEKYTRSPEVAASRFRELYNLALSRNASGFAYRLGFKRELPTLAKVGTEALRGRLQEMVLYLVEDDPEHLGKELKPRLNALDTFLASPPLELLESIAEAGGGHGAESPAATLFRLILYAVVFCEASHEQVTPVSVTLQQLSGLEAEDLIELPSDLAEAWWEILFDDLVTADPWSEAQELAFEHCLRLTWWLWKQDVPENARAFHQPTQRLKWLCHLGGQRGNLTRETLSRVRMEVVSSEDPATVERVNAMTSELTQLGNSANLRREDA